MMDEMTLKFMDGTRVKTPMGKGEVIGSVLRKIGDAEKSEQIVSLDEKPFTVFEKGTNPLLVWSFDPKDLEVLKNER
jgi:hypothetical protein